METIKVNMNPNPLDVQTIHASQNDGEARQWEFKLHNNGDVIDSSEVTDQMVFKAYKGGTEQLLPENGSTPTTSPFKGDIKYPQGLLTDQEFTYRQSPTESDGLAKITDIKGNTLNWNQLANVGTLNATANYSGYLNIGTFSFVANHKYLIKYHQDNTMASNTRNTLQVRFATVGQTVTENATANAHLSQGYYSWLFNSTYTDANTIVRFWVADNNVSVSYSNIMLIDLTAMGLDITDPSDFTSLFPLSYYSYNQGSLLSFNGNGIKTVGKNLFNESLYTNLKTSYEYEDSYYRCRKIQLIPNTTYTISSRASATSTLPIFINNAQHVNNSSALDLRRVGYSKTLTTDTSGCLYIGTYYTNTDANTYERIIECQVQIESGSVSTDYEPYTSSTLSLPISTYFPSGMKSAGNVYDELTESKAITRIGSVDLGTLTWYYSGGLLIARINDGAYTGSSVGSANGRCVLYEAKAVNPTALEDKQMTLGTAYAFANIGNIVVKDSAYTSASAFKTAISGVYLYYEQATPIETSFTTASLVTENTEIPLSNNDGVLIGKCTEQLSENPGFIDAKIKLSDSDGECYSNKIQLHVERSPQ